MLQAAIAALALPVSGFVIGKVVGDYALHPHAWMARVGAGIGLGVYLFTLLASYRHLRHWFHGFEPEHLNASATLAAAVEVATFYMSVTSVILPSAWAFAGSLVGAFVVFWGNLQSMASSRQHPNRARQSHAKAVRASESVMVANDGHR